eukprot:CAMPEP_0119004844 /NCGR_PEP_ID=MMETSP1176-20130426/1385_1 /TAXON_ID=265551 /ORGANISM="Synedropsis recta cf, Strain CCMP1620" /LENGTH=154 /DNA_ID=CAMNT_0006956597 /DNA_START=88 /DNA_END=552 /DNA_ORIENTATION=-
MRVTTLIAAALCVASSQAFMMPTRQMVSATSLRIMPADQMEALIAEAEECSEGECSVDDVGNLLDTLKIQQKDLGVKIDEIKKMITTLEKMNDKDMDRDEVRETVRAIMRIFTISDKASGNDFPYSGNPTGYSGEIGDGPTTAYSALNPKPYKP